MAEEVIVSSQFPQAKNQLLAAVPDWADADRLSSRYGMGHSCF